MADAQPTQLVGTLRCGACDLVMESTPGLLRCPRCSWEAELWLFDVPPRELEHAELAMPEDATCVHHPAKRADALCAGTGDYICRLCAVELQGQTYSAQYLNGPGKATLGRGFERHLARPDRWIMLMFVLSLLFWPVAPLLLAAMIWKYVQMLRLRRVDPIYEKVVSVSGVVVLTILIVVQAVVGLGIYAVVIAEMLTA